MDTSNSTFVLSNNVLSSPEKLKKQKKPQTNDLVAVTDNSAFVGGLGSSKGLRRKVVKVWNSVQRDEREPSKK